MMDMLCSYYASIMFLVSLLCFGIESPFVKIPHQHRIFDFLDSGDEEEGNCDKYLNR